MCVCVCVSSICWPASPGQALDAELRKLQEVVKAGCDAFDARLQELFQAKMATEQAVTCEELRMLKLAKAIQDDEVLCV
jgi:hypothetical protein